MCTYTRISGNMAAPILYLRFSLIKLVKSHQRNLTTSCLQSLHVIEHNCCQLQLYSLCQQRGFTSSSHYCQAFHTDEHSRHYNYGLSGKGKSRESSRHEWTSSVNGELLFGLHPIYLALKARRRKAFYNLYVHEKYGKNLKNVQPMLNKIFHLATELAIPIKFVRKNVLNEMAQNRPHQGFCLDAEELACMSWDENVVPDCCSKDPPLWLFLQNIQDPMNFGAILRSSYIMGIDKVIVPTNNSCKLSPVVCKASAGVLEVIDLLKLPEDTTEESFCLWWKSLGGLILGTHSLATNTDDVENNAKCVALQNFTLSRPSLLVLGNEGTGLSDDIARLCDVKLYIQSHQTGYQEEIDSLNVSVATANCLKFGIRHFNENGYALDENFRHLDDFRQFFKVSITLITGILLHWLQATKLKQPL